MVQTLPLRRDDVGNDADVRDLLAEIHHAAHFLPSQGPLSVFVHHNTLHAVEQLPFEEALPLASKVYGCRAYRDEQHYRHELSHGRILRSDLEAVLNEELGEGADELIGLLGTRFHLRMAMLEYPLRTGSSAEIRWVVAETEALNAFRADVPEETRTKLTESTRRWVTRELSRTGGSPAGEATSLSPALKQLIAEHSDADPDQWSDEQWESLCLRLLWRICCDGIRHADQPPPQPAAPARPRDLLTALNAQDPDELVHDVLIRFCSVFLDQGFAHWSLPDADQGLWLSFLHLYGQPGGVLPRWMQGLQGELKRIADESISPLESIEESLAALGIDERRRETFITATLLALRGWAGMIWQMETNAAWCPRPAPPGSLVEFLAVRLLLDRMALGYAACEDFGYRGALADLPQALPAAVRSATDENLRRAFLFFQLAQVMELRPEGLYSLPSTSWTRLAREADAFDEMERCRVFHLAYERRYRNQTLDAIAIHARRPAFESWRTAEAAPVFQIMCCLDDREESFRRHIEEVEPACETLSFAGFFAIGMYYRGAAEARGRPLCPVVMTPRHYVVEYPTFTHAESHRRRALARRYLGTAAHRLHHGSRSLVGGVLTALLGSIASIPLVARIMFPRVAAQIRRFAGRMASPSATQLLIERTESEPGLEEGHIGFSLPEMVDSVERVLRDSGLTSNFARLVIICGHGASTANNPHASAYDCGACGGGRGGPNARAFAKMANDQRVRSRLADRGLILSDEVQFIGAFHNTCDDSVTYFDLDDLPLSHQPDFESARQAIDVARQRNAHERCRRFESAPLSLTPETALRHVEERSEDLAQVRPECGHATNAVCFVGRRSRTRGLFLDRRNFLTSYDPSQDTPDHAILTRVLTPVFPVCGGISLEYYFSFIDSRGYGCGTKLPHNVTSMLGVMDGAASDLRSGLPWQMVEIHEPMRLLFVVESTPTAMLEIFERNPAIAALVEKEWVQLATLDPHSPRIDVYHHGAFHPYDPETFELPEATSSADWYRGWRDHLGYARIVSTS